MTYRAPIDEQLFLLDWAGGHDPAGAGRLEGADAELMAPVLGAAAELAEGSYLGL